MIFPPDRARVAVFHCVAAALLVCAWAAPASGQQTNYTWIGASNNLWFEASNWNPAGVPGVANVYVTFDGAGNGHTAIDLGGGITNLGMLFNPGAAAYTIGTPGQSLTLPGQYYFPWITVSSGVTNDQTIAADIQFGQGHYVPAQIVFSNNSSAALTFSGATMTGADGEPGDQTVLYLAGNGTGLSTINSQINENITQLGIIKQGTGTWQLLNPSNNFGGGSIYIQGGTLVVSSLKNVGEPSSIGVMIADAPKRFQLAMNNDATLRYVGETTSTDWDWTIGGSAGITGTFDVVGGTMLSMNGRNSLETASNLRKAGAGTLGLGATNNLYSGATIISEGALSVWYIGNGGQASGIGKSSAAATNLVFDGGTLRYNNGEYIGNWTDRAFSITPGKTAGFDVTETNIYLPITGSVPFTTGGLSKTGAGNLLLAGNNAYTGPTTVTQGKLVAGASSTDTGGPFGINSDTDLTSAGSLVLFHNLTDDMSYRFFNATIGSLAGLPGSIVNLGQGTLTLASSNDATFAGEIGPGAPGGNGGLVKTTPSPSSPGGMQTLTGSNSYTGATVITTAAYAGAPVAQAGGITLSGTNGSIASSSAIVISGGATLAVENSGTAVNTNRIGDTTSVTMSGGTLSFATDAFAPGASETVGALVLNGGNNTISNGQAGFGKTSTLTFASFARNGSATVNFAGTGLGLNDQNRIFFTDAPALGDWALYNGTGYATYNSTNGIVEAEYADVTRLSSGSKIIYTATNGNIRVIDGTGTPGPIELSSTNTQIAGLAQTATGGPVTIDTSGNTFGITSVLVGSNAGTLTIGTAPGSGQLTSSFDAISLINNSTNSLVVNATVVDAPLEGGAYPIAVTKTGSGTAFLAGTNTYTGVTTLGQGVLSVSSIGDGGVAGNLGAAGNATTNIVFNGGTLHYTGTNTTTDRGFTVAASGSRLDSDADIQFSGSSINLASGSLTIGGAGNTTVSSLMTGAGALHKDGASTLALQGQNTFTGGVTIRGGAVSVTNIGNGGQAGNLGAASKLSANLVLDGGSLVYNAPGMTGSDRGITVTSNGGTFVNANAGAAFFLANGSPVSIAQGGVFSVDGPGSTIVGNVISGAGTLRKTGEGIAILENPANSFTGGVTISEGSLLIDGISNGGVDGYLGAATADPANLVFDGGTLSFTPSGPAQAQSTDRGFTITTGKTATIAVTNNASLTISGNVPATTGALTKTGNGTLALSGTLAFTGEATASAGLLNIDGTLGPGATPGDSLSVAAGSTLGGSGTIQRDVYISGTHSPGSSPGLQTIDGAVIYNPGATVVWGQHREMERRPVGCQPPVGRVFEFLRQRLREPRARFGLARQRRRAVR